LFVLVRCSSRFKEYQFPLELYRGPNAAFKFVERLLEVNDEIQEILKRNEEMIITPEQELEFKKAHDCHICLKKLGEDRVRDHCHITGLYRGPAHNECNKKYYNDYEVPVFFHNLKGYDSHLIVKELGKFEKKIDCISQSSEKFISFKVGNLVFKDSFAFMSTSLDKLSQNMKPEQFLLSREYYKNLEYEKFLLLIKKGVYPYDYTDSFERFNETELPTKKFFLEVV